MRRKLVVGNWKMHGSKDQVRQLLQQLESAVSGLAGAVDVGVCPTHLHIGLSQETLQSGVIQLGAQNACAESPGAFTGEIAVSMLAEYKVSLVLVGHSERRILFGESDAVVADKFAAALQCGLTPILCVGESLQQRQQGKTAAVVLAQLEAVIAVVGIDAMARGVLAYEPIWAIGTGQTATPEQAQQVHHLLRGHIAKQNRKVATDIRIIYGGSVNGANASELFEQADIDGGLVGGASLKAEEFISICKSAD